MLLHLIEAFVQPAGTAQNDITFQLMHLDFIPDGIGCQMAEKTEERHPTTCHKNALSPLRFRWAGGF